MSNVEFRELPEYEGYRFGSDGSVWSCWKRKGLGTPYGTCSMMVGQWTPLKPILNQNGYFFVNLRTTCGTIKRNLLIHRLLLQAFGCTRESEKHTQACHNNGVRTDNRIDNLRWGTQKDNARDRRKHGTSFRWSIADRLSLADDDMIAWLRSQGVTVKAITERFGISKATVLRAQKRCHDEDRQRAFAKRVS